MNQTQIDLLTILSAVLFDTRQPMPELSPELKKEARAQAVYSLLPLEKDALRTKIFADNIRLQEESRELHDILTEAQIPYVILKGWASARYYPEPLSRTGGDVDFLIRESDFPQATALLTDHGFKAGKDDGMSHVALTRPPRTHWEMHRHPNGAGESTEKYFAALPDAARSVDGMRLPSDFHHCLVLLCHTASHLTKEGLGLRHLCDWAVFAYRVDVSQWEAELKDCGLWQLAKTLSQLCAAYLQLPERSWFGSDEKNILPALMEDIFTAGNFGRKDADRYRQIKYVADGEHRVEQGNAIVQAWGALNRKATAQNKTRLAVLADYAGMLLRGERKIDTLHTLSEAEKRRELYRALRLYQRES